MIQIYKFFGFILIPIIKLNIYLRIKNGKEDSKRYKERYGKILLKRPSNKLIWIHAASIGEFKSAEILINAFYKEYSILITTTTLSAANFAKDYYSDKIIHQYAPLDISPWINNFLSHWKPNLVIWIESDLWPATLQLLKIKKIKSLLFNVRMSPQSFTKWKKIKFFYKEITDCFDEITAQSEIDKDRIKQLTNRDIKYIGNLKLAKKLKNEIIDKNYSIKNKNFTTIMFASTHQEEEELIISLIDSLLINDGIKIILAPRHPERSQNILLKLKKRNIPAAIKSDNIKNSKIEIINSFGVLSKYFEISDIVFLGGSLIKKGGHNPIEPATKNCAILTGPYLYNWQNVYENMISDKACIKIHHIKELELKIKNLINNNKLLAEMKKNSKIFSSQDFFDKEKIFKLIKIKLSET